MKPPRFPPHARRLRPPCRLDDRGGSGSSTLGIWLAIDRRTHRICQASTGRPASGSAIMPIRSGPEPRRRPAPREKLGPEPRRRPAIATSRPGCARWNPNSAGSAVRAETGLRAPSVAPVLAVDGADPRPPLPRRFRGPARWPARRRTTWPWTWGPRAGEACSAGSTVSGLSWRRSTGFPMGRSGCSTRSTGTSPGCSPR